MALKRILDYLFVVYFGTHIPITLLFDVQVLFGDSLHPQVVSLERGLSMSHGHGQCLKFVLIIRAQDDYMCSVPST